MFVFYFNQSHIYSSFIFGGLAGFEKSAWSAPSLHWPAPRCLINDTATRRSLLVHGEAALHGALGEQLQNRGPVPHHLHERHREPDEDSRQDQGEEDQQPGLGRRQHPQGQHGGGGGGRAGARPGPNRYALCASAS